MSFLLSYPAASSVGQRDCLSENQNRCFHNHPYGPPSLSFSLFNYRKSLGFKGPSVLNFFP